MSLNNYYGEVFYLIIIENFWKKELSANLEITGFDQFENKFIFSIRKLKFSYTMEEYEIYFKKWKEELFSVTSEILCPNCIQLNLWLSAVDRVDTY